MENKLKPGLIYLIIGVFVLILFSGRMIKSVDAGERGVLFNFFTGVQFDKVYSQGIHLIAPWNKLVIYEVREQQKEETMDVLSSNGLSIQVDVSARFAPYYDSLPYLHDQFGPTYIQRLVIPEIRSAVREVIGRYTPEELYSTKRDEVQKSIFEASQNALGNNFIDTKALLIRSVKLPKTIQTAIESKLEREQESLEYEFRLEREKKEAERKRIEAQGIDDFQRIVSEGISDKLLKWKGIEATETLANSPNAKVIVIGSGEEGLPIILGGN